MSKRIAVLGSTGSIGRQSLDVIDACGMSVAALTANSSVERMEEQARQFKPELVALVDEKAADDLRVRLADTNVKVAGGMSGLLEAAAIPSADTVITSVVGMVGLRPTLAAIREGKRIALANKETLVCAGELVLEEARDYGAQILPVDSEHSALFQSLEGNNPREVKRLILTCSGGPFYGKKAEELEHVTREDALRHPNWSMGAKITVDSATLMNKGLEFIEAMHLYHMPPEKISVLIHRESIIHSLVEYCDNAMIAQLGSPDMRLPIQYALTWPRRIPGPAAPLDLWRCGGLTFGTPDTDTFRCLALAYEAARMGGTAGAILNGANEAAVAQFLAGRIGFLDVARRVERAMERVAVVQEPGLEDILNADQEARRAALDSIFPRSGGFMLYIIVGILIFGALIAVHEFGHFITAKLFGVRVNEFAIGMGPAIFHRQRGETEYSLRLFPVGGYCAMEGEDDDSDDPRAFGSAKLWKKLIVLCAGAFMNFLVGLVMLLFLYRPMGDAYAGPMEGYGTENCGLQKGDVFLSVDGQPVNELGQTREYLSQAGDTVDLVVRRDGQEIELTVYLPLQTRTDEEGTTTRMRGIMVGRAPVPATVTGRLSYAWDEALYFARVVWLSLRRADLRAGGPAGSVRPGGHRGHHDRRWAASPLP